jgi:hypothetical protein
MTFEAVDGAISQTQTTDVTSAMHTEFYSPVLDKGW